MLNREISFKEITINVLKEELEKVTLAKDNINLSIEALQDAKHYNTERVDKFLEKALIGKAKSGMGYKLVPPPFRGIHPPLGIDLEHTGLEEFKC